MSNIKERTINTIRALAVDAINKANSGHPGLPLGAAPMAYCLWADNMRHNPTNSSWMGRDRFVLSAGHGSALLYSLLHTFGYNVTMEDLKSFRQWGSITPGHPEYGITDGIETTTGPLGQGFANAVGMEIAREHMSSIFDKDDIKLFDNYTYTILGDGCIMEGVVSEAASLAGHLKLSNLIALYDDNNITIEGKTDIAFSEDVEKRFLSYGFEVLKVNDGNNIDDINKAIIEAKKSERPTLIMVKTIIGFGSPNFAGTSKVHGSPLGKEEAELAKKQLGIESKEFFVPEDVKEHLSSIRDRLKKENDQWNKKYEDYKNNYPKDFEMLEYYLKEKKQEDFNIEEIASFNKDTVATREAVGIALNKMAEKMPSFIGGSADLAPSTKTYLNSFEAFSAENRNGRNLHFGIREHAMGALVNGIILYLDKKLRSYGSTFLVFSDYMRHTLRLASLMKIPSFFIFTHDSVGVGEDGPTHQPVEHVASLRLIPGLYVVRPADARETAFYTRMALCDEKTVCMALSRQGLPVLSDVDERCLKGGYIISEKKDIKAQIIATGSEVSLALEAQKSLSEKGINVNVVSMPCVELFEDQDDNYKDKVLKDVPTLVIEAGVSDGWYKYAGRKGRFICVDTFGESAPAGRVFEEFGFNVSNVENQIKEII